jgi:hypothetical protein
MDFEPLGFPDSKAIQVQPDRSPVVLDDPGYGPRGLPDDQPAPVAP